MLKSFGFLLFDDVEELDFVGPWELLGVWREYEAGELAMMTISETGDPVRCHNGLKVVADHSYESCPALDYLLVPGGDGRRHHMAHEPTLNFLRQQERNCHLLLSVCTGSFLLHAAGLADDENLTTHWHAISELRTTGANVLPHRYVKGQRIWSAAGVSAGIDMILALIAAEAGEDVAGEVQALAEYYPDGRQYRRRSNAAGPAYI